MLRDDRRGQPLREWRADEVFAELSVHADPMHVVQSVVGDVARQRVPKIEVRASPIAQAAGAEAGERLVAREARQRDDLGARQRSTRNREPIDDGAFLVR